MAATQSKATSPFGAMLRELRLARGFSQEALAERATLSPRTISDLERGVKTRPHPATMRFLAEALELEPDERARLVAASRPSAQTTPPAAPQRPRRIPRAPSPLIGRDDELAAALDHIGGATQLVTITGPGGVGKTRLAVEIAGTIEDRGQREVAFVELGPVSEPSLVIPTIAASLGIEQRADLPLDEAIRDHVAGGALLLVLDNCEHLLDGVRPVVADLIAASPGIAILATSRPPLHLRGEQALPLAPWMLPEPSDIARLADLDRFPAVALFLQRAGAARADLALTDDDARDVVDICRRLDGLPLALELAAIRLRALSIRSLAGLLDERLRLLTQGPYDAPERHRTLRETITWSHELLTGSQKAFFRRLAVLAGGCTLDTATRVAAGNDPFAALDGLEALVDQGLVLQTREPDDEIRFRMLGTVREYAQERLGASGEVDAVYAALAAQVIDLAEQSDPSDPGAMVARLTREQANIRTALAWSLGDTGHGGSPATALRLAAALWPFWHMRGQYQEGHGWLERAIAQAGQVDPATRAQAFLTLANIANNLEDHAHAQSLYEESLHISEEFGNERGIASAMIGLGMVATNTGAYDRAQELLDEALALCRTANAPGILACLYGLGQLSVARGDLEAAGRRFEETRQASGPEHSDVLAYVAMEEARIARYRGNLTLATELATACLARFRELGERRAEAVSQAELGHLALLRTDLDEAATLLRGAATHHAELRDEFGVVTCLETYICLAASRERHDVVARLGAVAETWRKRTRTARVIPDRMAFDRAVSAARAADPDHFDAAWSAGSIMSLELALVAAESIKDSPG